MRTSITNMSYQHQVRETAQLFFFSERFMASSLLTSFLTSWTLSLCAIMVASLVSTTTMLSRPTTVTSLPLPCTRQFRLSSTITSPRVTLPFSSFSRTSQSEDHDPTSLQPADIGTTQASSVFSITA